VVIYCRVRGFVQKNSEVSRDGRVYQEMEKDEKELRERMNDVLTSPACFMAGALSARRG
jgi:hypothetical protein